MAIAYPSQPIFGPQPEDYSDVGIAFRKGARGLSGQMLDILPKSIGGEFLRGIGLEEQGNQWLSDAYASGILMGMDINELDKHFEGPRTLSDISDAKGALAYGVNAFAEQVPTLMAQFAPAVASVALRRFGAPIPKWVTPASIIGTLGWMNTADVYTRLLMDAGESRLGVAAGTATLMTALDMLVPLRVINRMNRGVDFTKYVGKKLRLPDSPLKLGLAGAIEGGVMEGTTEYVQTIFENMALNYVKDNDLLQEFSEEQEEELREAAARGAIVGGVLTGAVATGMGVKSARDRAKLIQKLSTFGEDPYASGIIADRRRGLAGPETADPWKPQPPIPPSLLGTDDPSAHSFWEEPLKTMDVKRLTAPLDGAINQKVMDYWGAFKEDTLSKEREVAIRESQGRWQIEDRKRVWKAILEGDMEKGLDIADQNMLYDWTDTLLEERAIAGMEREITPSELVTVPVERGQRRLGFAAAGDIPLFSPGKKAWKGWYPTDRIPIMEEIGTPKKKGKDRGEAFANVYENEKYILRPETEMRGAPWVVIDKASGTEVDRNKLQKVLMDKYATAPVEAGEAQTEKKLKSEDRITPPWSGPFDTRTLGREEKAETQAQRHEQELGERGVLQAGINDKVKFYQLNEVSGEWEYPSDETYTVEDIWYAGGNVTGPVTRGERIKANKTLEEYKKEGPVSVIFSLRNERSQIVEDFAIGPNEDSVRVVPRLRSAWKIPQFFGPPKGEAEQAMTEDVRTEEDVEELYRYTPEGERFLIAQERGANLKRFRELMEDEAFRDRFVQALANAQIKRAENANTNVIKYSAFRTEGQLKQFIKDSNKTNTELGIPVPRRVIEEEEWVKRQAKLEAEERLNENERLALVRAGEARIEGMDEDIALEREVTSPPDTPEATGEMAVTTEELEGEPKPEDTRRRVWREFPEWKKLLRAREKELKRKSGGLTKEEINELRADEWGDKPVGEMVVSRKAAPATTASRKKVVGTAKTAITKRLKALNAPELARQQLEITRQMEARGITVVQLEAHPKDASLFEVKDLETGALPAPETHEIKIKPEVAEEHGLNPGFFYPYMEALWAGKKYKGFVNVEGQYIRRDDVVDLREITGRAKAPEEGEFVELSTVQQVFKKGAIIQRDPELREGAVIPSYSLPDGIPGQETITKAWIDVKTGIIIVQRESTIRMEDLERVDVDYDFDYEIYLTWYDREEHAVKLRELSDRLLNIEREATEESRATGVYEKPRRKMIKTKERKIDLSKDKSIITDGTIFKTRRIEVTANSSALARINRERRDFFFDEKIPQSPLNERSRFRVMPVYGDKLQPIGKEGEQFNRMLPKTRKNLVRLVSWDGQSYVVNVNSLDNAYILSRDVPEKTGVMIPYEELVREGPSKGVRLIGSFKGTIQEEATAMEDFMAEMFTPQTHAFGRYGTKKEKFLNSRSALFEKEKGEQALIEFFDGTLMEGTIGKVRKSAGTVEIITSKKEWKRDLPVEIDILSYDRIQFLEKPEKGVFVAGKIKDISPSDRQYSNVIYVPALVPPTYFRSKSDSGLNMMLGEFPTLSKVDAPSPPDVEVVKGERLGQPIYTITVDGRVMSDKVVQKEATTILNELYEENDQKLNVIAMPEGLRWDGYVEPEAPVEQNVVDVTSKQGLVTQIKLNMPVTIIHKGSKRKQEGKFVDFVYSTEEATGGGIGGTVHFLANKGKVMRRLLVNEISYFYDVDALQAEKDQKKLEADIAKIEKVVAKAVKGKPKKTTVKDEGTETETETETVVTGPVRGDKEIRDEKGNVIFEGYKVSKETQAKVDPSSADTKTKKIDEVKTTPIGSLKIPQRFEDSTGAEWEVSQHIGNMEKTVLKWVGGTKPDIKINFEFNGKRETLEWQENQEIIVDSKVAPTSIFTKEHKQTTFRGATGEGISRATSIEKGRYIPYFSIVRDSVGRGDRGGVSYNTGLTPKTFREFIAKRIGRLQLARLEKDGVIRIVQNQIDVPNPPNDMGIHAVVRNGQVWFVTNNIREEDIGGVFAHEIGTHIGLLTVYGEDIHQYILDSARELRDSSDVWKDSFAAAETVYAKISASPELVSKEYQERWKNFTDEEAADFIAEEAVGYYTEAMDPMNDSFWRMLIDMLLRGKARVKKFFGMKMSEAEIIAFIRGAIRGTINKKYDNIKARREEYYSAAFGEGMKEKFYDYVNDKLKDHDSYRVQKAVASASNFRQKIGTFFNPFKYLPQEGLFRKFRSETQGKLGEVYELGEEIKKTYQKLTAIEKEELYKFFTDRHAKAEIISNVKLRENSVKYRQIIMDVGLEAYRKKIIPEVQREQFEELYGEYLPRVFLAHLLSGKKGATTPFGFKASQQYWSEQRLELSELKKDLLGEVTDPAYLVYKAITVPQQDMIILDFLETLSMAQAFTKDSSGRDLPPWILPEQWISYEFVDPLTKKTMKRRTTVQALAREIESYQLVRNHVKTPENKKIIIDKEIAKLKEVQKKFYEDKGGSEDAAQTYYDEKYDTKMFRQIPKSRRFGAMAGLWVRKEIYADILGNSENSFGEQHFLQKMFSPHGRHAKIVGIFKMLKVPMNPPTVARNAVNNMMLLHLLGGVPLHQQPALILEAYREAIKGEKGTVFTDSITGKSFTAYELAKKQGITASTMISAEIRKMEAFLVDIERDGVLSWTTNFQKYWSKASEVAGGIYQNLEIIGKVAYINHALTNQREHLEKVRNEPKNLGPNGTPNVTIEDVAVQEANRVLFDYSEVSPFVRGMRSSFFGAPFITYQVKVLPQILKVAAENPLRFLPYVALFAGAQAAFGSMPFQDDDWDKIMRLMPEWIRDQGHAMIMPYKDEHGRLQVADLSYYFPWAGLTNFGGALGRGELKEAVQEFGLIAPAWQVAIALAENKDTWSGRTIVDPNGTASDRAMDMFNYAWSMSMPSIMTRSGIVNMPSLLEAAARMDPSELEGKIFDATMDRTNRYGDPKRDLASALLSIVGFNTYPIAPNARGRQLRRYKAEIESYRRSITRAKDDVSLSKSQENRRVNALKDKIDEIRKKRKEFGQGTAGVTM